MFVYVCVLHCRVDWENPKKAPATETTYTPPLCSKPLKGFPNLPYVFLFIQARFLLVAKGSSFPVLCSCSGASFLRESSLFWACTDTGESLVNDKVTSYPISGIHCLWSPYLPVCLLQQHYGTTYRNVIFLQDKIPFFIISEKLERLRKVSKEQNKFHLKILPNVFVS